MTSQLDNGYMTVREFMQRVLPPNTYSASSIRDMVAKGLLPQFERFGRELLIRPERVSLARDAVIAHKAGKRQSQEAALARGRLVAGERSRDGGPQIARLKQVGLLTEIRDLLVTQTQLLQDISNTWR